MQAQSSSDDFRAASTDPLVEAALAGKPEAQSQLLRRVAPAMRRAVMVVLNGQHPNLDDVLQDSMIAFMKALPAFRGESQPHTYAARIAARTALAARHRQRSTPHFDTEEDEQAAPSSRNPQRETDSARRRNLMLDLLDELPAEQAETLGLRVVMGMSLQEVAEATDAPVNTVRSRVRLAKEALRKRIEAQPDLYEDLAEGA